MKVKLLSHVRLLATPWTAAHQAPPSMGFSRLENLEWGAIAFSAKQVTKADFYGNTDHIDHPGEGNGNPLQHSCLENLMDGGA